MCRQVHADVPGRYKLKFILRSAIERLTANFVQKANALLVATITNFPFEFFMLLLPFTPHYFFYTKMQNIQRRPKVKSRGYCLRGGAWGVFLFGFVLHRRSQNTRKNRQKTPCDTASPGRMNVSQLKTVTNTNEFRIIVGNLRLKLEQSLT